MSNIVDELRERSQFNDDLESRAAAEIEKLREEIELLHAELRATKKLALML